MELLKSKSVIAFVLLVMVVSYVSAMDGVKSHEVQKSHLISEKA